MKISINKALRIRESVNTLIEINKHHEANGSETLKPSVVFGILVYLKSISEKPEIKAFDEQHKELIESGKIKAISDDFKKAVEGLDKENDVDKIKAIRGEFDAKIKEVADDFEKSIGEVEVDIDRLRYGIEDLDCLKLNTQNIIALIHLDFLKE